VHYRRRVSLTFRHARVFHLAHMPCPAAEFTRRSVREFMGGGVASPSKHRSSRWKVFAASPMASRPRSLSGFGVCATIAVKMHNERTTMGMLGSRLVDGLLVLAHSTSVRTSRPRTNLTKEARRTLHSASPSCGSQGEHHELSLRVQRSGGPGPASSETAGPLARASTQGAASLLASIDR